MEASMKSGMVVVEEWLQEKYVEFYDDNENYTSKLELIAAKIPNLFFKEGSKNYIVNEGNIHYLLNKSVIPDNLRENLKGGNSEVYADYARLIDVYGVTNDLKLYYCDDKGKVICGKYDDIEINPSEPLKKANQNSKIRDAVNSSLGNADLSKELTLTDAQTIKELTLTGLDDIGGIEELRGLRKLVLDNCKLSSIDELLSCTKLEYLYLKNSTIQNYSVMPNLYGLKKLYLYFPASESDGQIVRTEEDSNEEIKRLSLAMTNASKLSNLEYLGIFGKEYVFTYDMVTGGREVYGIEDKDINNLSDLETLSTWNKTVKNSVKYVYFNNNNISNLDFLSEYKNIYEAWLFGCGNLENLSCFKNHKSIANLVCQNTSKLGSLKGLSGTKNLVFLCIRGDNNITSLGGLESCINLSTVYASRCDIQDITALNQIDENKKYIGKLNYLDLENNINLKSIKILSNCINIRNLYLKDNVNMIDDDVKCIEEIIKLCGNKYSLPQKYQILFASTVNLDLSGDEFKDIDDYSTEISAIKNRTNLKCLRLPDRNKLGSSQLAKLIKLNKLEIAELNNILDNLSELTAEQKEYIKSLINLGEEKIKEMTDEEINEKEENNDIYLRYVISCLTDLRRLTVRNISNLTKIDFINTAKKLSELDYRGTNVTNLTLLNTKALRLGTLYTNGEKTDLSTIQPAINRIYDNYSNDSDLKCAWSGRNYNPINDTGLLIANYKGIENAFSNCSDITSLRIGNIINDYDLTGCTKLENIYGINGKIILPNRNLKSVFLYYATVDGSSCPKVDSLTCWGCRNWGESCEYLKNTEIIEFGNTSRITYLYPNIFGEIAKMNGSKHTLKKIFGAESFSDLYNGWFVESGNLERLEGFTVLEQVECAYGRDSDILTGAEKIPTLKNINVRGNNISDISSLYKLDKMTNLYLKDNCISTLWTTNDEGKKVSVFEKMSKLETLELSTNLIEDLEPLECLLDFKDENGKLVLKSLDIENNSLERYSISGTDNLKIINEFISGGCSVSYDESDFETK